MSQFAPPPTPPPPSPPHTNTHTPTAHLVLDSHCAVVLSGRGQKRRGWGTVRGVVVVWWVCGGGTFSSEADFEIVIIIFKASKLSLSLSLTLSPSKLKEMKVCLCSIPCYITSMH